MTYNVLMGTLSPAHSLTRSLTISNLRQFISPHIPVQKVIRCWGSDLSRPPRGGGGLYPQFSRDTPQPSEVQRGLSGACLCDRDGRGNTRGQIL